MGTIVRETLPVIDAITERIEADQLSLREAGARLGVSYSTVRNWQHGIVTPPLNAEMQAKIACFLGVSPRRVVELYQLDLSSEALRP